MRHSKRSLEGYLIIDNRVGPRVPKMGDAMEIPAGATWESATVTCSHCHCVVILNPDRTRERHYCAKCDKYICDGCAVLQECRPLNAIFDALQTQAARGR
jgi:hypothetical protein